VQLNADFSRRVVIHTQRLPWAASPIAGVERRMLDRIGGEVARATSVVRYAPGSRFAAHTHYGGEEFLVLDGVFQDEHGDYPRGTYVRNPPQSAHRPASLPGCTIFVKLWQFDLMDRQHVRLDAAQLAFSRVAGRAGVALAPLYSDDCEDVRVERWDAGASVTLDLPDGGEFLVLEGDLTEGEDRLTMHAWLRLPAGAVLRATAGANGCRLWVKTGHLGERCLSQRAGPPPALLA
jgi:anti-sigma factor ChrR (cupin superfamily)